MGLNEYVKVGSLIKELRLSKGYTAKEFSKKIHIPYSTYSNYENNNREPNTEVLQKICENLGITVEELLRLSTLPLELRDCIIDALIENDSHTLSHKKRKDFYAFFDPSEFTIQELNDIKEYITFIKYKRKKITE